MQARRLHNFVVNHCAINRIKILNMDFLWDFSDKLQPYAGHVASAAMVVTTCQLLTPALLVNEIRKAKSSDKFPIAPFIGGFVLSVLFVIFGQIINDQMTIKINLFGVALNVVSWENRKLNFDINLVDHEIHSIDLSNDVLHLHTDERQVVSVGQNWTGGRLHCSCSFIYDRKKQENLVAYACSLLFDRLTK